MLETKFYQENRKKLSEYMVDNSFYFVHSGSELESTYDECFLFEPYRNFLYLTGVSRPDALFVMTKIDGVVKETLFMHIPTPRETMYTGATFDKEKLMAETGIANVVDINTWEDFLSRMMIRYDIQDAYMDMARWRSKYFLNKEQLLAHELKESYPYLNIHNAYQKVCSLRTVKSAPEIEAHRKAVKITEEGVKNMLKHMKPGMMECQIEAYYDFILKGYNVKAPAFTTIAATGINACTLHYVDNDTVTKDGDMILFDLGAKWDQYCADVSRTYPVNGKFSPRQKELYNVVLKGLDAAISLSKPGQKKADLQLISKKVMAEELIKIGKISKPEEIDKYYFHGSGHFIGLDTHDVGDYDEILLEKDMMFTLEPGLYFKDEGIGIRIEDTILITEDGCDVFSKDIPKTVEEIERFMSGE